MRSKKRIEILAIICAGLIFTYLLGYHDGARQRTSTEVHHP
jgi:hypothetical protein